MGKFIGSSERTLKRLFLMSFICEIIISIGGEVPDVRTTHQIDSVFKYHHLMICDNPFWGVKCWDSPGLIDLGQWISWNEEFEKTGTHFQS